MADQIRGFLEQYIQESKAGEMPIHEFAFLDPKTIPFLKEVRDMCEANRCGMYGRTWTCPPGVGELEVLRDKYQAYEHALLYSTRHELEDSFDFEGMGEGNKVHHKLDQNLMKKMNTAGFKYALLGAEGCHLCAKCTYPDDPCRNPELVHPSIEATGVSVVDLSRQVGIRYINGANTVTYFSMILW